MEAPHLIAEVRKEARFTAEMSVSTIESKDLEREQLNRPSLFAPHITEQGIYPSASGHRAQRSKQKPVAR